MDVQIRHQPETSRGVKVGTDFLLRRRNAATEKGRRSQPLETAIETSTAAEELDIHGGRERRRRKNRRRRNGGILETAPSELVIAKSSNSPMPPLQLLLAFITSFHYPHSHSQCQHNAL